MTPATTGGEVSDPFWADCWRCANLAADKLPADDNAGRLARRMYLCPECGDKRCQKAADHELSCDRGERERGHMEVQRLFETKRQEQAATDLAHAVALERERIAAWLETDVAWNIDGLSGMAAAVRSGAHNADLRGREGA